LSADLEIKGKAAFEHGRLDFKAGARFDPETPLVVYRDLCKEDRDYIMASWAEGWTTESLNGVPA